MSSLQNSIPPKVFLSPFVLSTVMLDNSNCPGDQEGFLIGRSYKSVRFEINDQSMCNAEEDLMISVFSAYPCGNFLSFYNSKGVINVDFIKNFLGDRIKSVVGWYRYRRNVPPYPSAREAIIHRNLMKAFSGNIAIGDNYFVYGVFGSSTSDSGATHTYDYAFYIERPDRFVPLVMSMLNLIDTKTKYRSGSLASSFVNSQTFDSVLNISWSFESCWQTEDGIQQMHKLLREKCSNLAEELTASECVNATIEEDIKLLEDELESLTMIEKPSTSSEEDESADGNVDPENVENIPPQGESRNTKQFRKRYWSEVVDFESEKRHPVYGKYFEQNRAQDQECVSQASSEASDSSYILPPQKKFKVLQEHKRVIDHDYSSASDEDSHKYVQDMEEDKADDFDGVSLPSETEDYGSTDDSKSTQDLEMDIPSDNIPLTKGTETKVKSLFVDNQKNVHVPQKKVTIPKIIEDPSTGKVTVLGTRIPLKPKTGTSPTPVTTKSLNLLENQGAVSQEVVVYTQKVPAKEESINQSVSLADKKEDKEKAGIIQTEEDSSSDPSPDSGSVGRPHIIYCKPADKEQEGTDSQK